jgi:Zn-dependent protease with chaperone function
VEQAKWEALVRRLEPEARTDPDAYRRKVVLLAALGYVFIGALLVAVLGLGALVVFLAAESSAVLLKFLIPIAILLWIVVRSLYVKFDPPDGIPLRRKDVPGLHSMIDEARRAIDGPKVHTVLLDGDANAGIVQVPRTGGVFGSRNYLALGLPYLQALSADQLRAVVAHELGHLSRAHGRFGAFVYRVRTTWATLLEGFEQRKSIWSGLVRRFFEWYVPHFNAYTFPVARAHEFEADDAAADAAGHEAAGSALVAGMLAGRWLHDSYWPEVYGRAIDEPSPGAAFAPLGGRIAEAKLGDDVDRWFRRLLEEETDVFDTHPSLAERLAHLGLDPQAVLGLARETGHPSAAATYLGEAEATLVAALDGSWRTSTSATATARRRRRRTAPGPASRPRSSRRRRRSARQSPSRTGSTRPNYPTRRSRTCGRHSARTRRSRRRTSFGNGLVTSTTAARCTSSPSSRSRGCEPHGRRPTTASCPSSSASATCSRSPSS